MDYFNPYVKDISLGCCAQPQSSNTVLRIGLQNSQNIYLCLLESKVPSRHNINPLQLYSVTPTLFLPRHFPSRKCLPCLPTCHINTTVYSYTFHLFYPILPLYLNFILHDYIYYLCLYMTVTSRILIAIFILTFYQFLVFLSDTIHPYLCPSLPSHSSTPVFLVLSLKCKINTTF